MDTYPAGYRTIRAGLGAWVRAFNRVAVTGLEHVPAQGGALVCASHEGMADPVFVCTAITHRYVRALAEKAFTDLPGLGTFMRAMGAIPVPVALGKSADRAGSDAAVDAMVAHLGRGGLGLWFPEGMIRFWTDRDELYPFRTGAVRAAARAGVPVIPLALYGSRWASANVHRVTLGPRRFPLLLPLVLPVKVRLAFGPALTIEAGAANDPMIATRESERLRAAVEHLRDGLRR